MGNHRGMSAWQLAMMALGTVVGGSFFLGSSVAIKAAGPAVLISYVLGAVLVYFILYSLSEMTVANAAPGSFRSFAGDVFGPGVSFVVGWVYWTGLILAMSSEATAVSLLIREWLPDISISLVGSMIIIAVTLINLLGADNLSKLESSLAAIKLLAIIAFILMALSIISGIMPGITRVGLGELNREMLFPAGLGGVAGSMLIVLLTYAGFETIGLAASEAQNPVKTVPKAINYTVFTLVGLYVICIAVIMPLVPTDALNEEISPMVAALNRWGIDWAGTVLNIVLITAILSTMLAAMFGLGRMIRSLALDGQAPKWLKTMEDVPRRGIIFSGIAMLVGMSMSLILPETVYIFLLSSSGFALLFTYAVILATHIRFRKKYGCPPNGKCQMPAYPYSDWIALTGLVAIIVSMPLVPGQGSGLIAGLIIVAVYSSAYLVMRSIKRVRKNHKINNTGIGTLSKMRMSMEASEELTDKNRESDKDRSH
ncbi:amino acid permease [Clostridium thermarum]|uniref:amino acid permease n=1 Tax=Clostridium thermarum TaxID=1716543 RepID=UPI001121758E|nr:amino acid permease [Clostridium thermarum]